MSPKKIWQTQKTKVARISQQWRKNPFNIFTPLGKSLHTTQPFDLERIAFLFEGGRFIWPGIRKGHSIKLPIGFPYIQLKTLNMRPLIFEIFNLITVGEAEYLMEQSKPLLRRSEVGITIDKKVSDSRTCKSAWLFGANDVIVDSIKNRVSRIVNAPKSHMEDMEVIHYNKNEKVRSNHKKNAKSPKKHIETLDEDTREYDYNYDYRSENDNAISPLPLCLLQTSYCMVDSKIVSRQYDGNHHWYSEFYYRYFCDGMGNGQYDNVHHFEQDKGIEYWEEEKWNSLHENGNDSDSAYPIDQHEHRLFFQGCYENKGLSIEPKQGKAILFYNMLPNGDIDMLALHGGCPTICWTLKSSIFFFFYQRINKEYQKMTIFRNLKFETSPSFLFKLSN
ncbi:hypothetical protein RFI_22592 [Reticulomyxa filosa]|uniref:Prolyl 4-hydroxylase alpha subunit domain-containing protein n=1 Tax=Reticulomyxa filosa TaxID=46433 RepID=X6MLM5_RETFI|nr:hypothetical protein RFI_22592 [Reticulomyxa filosa]|eukprot:ETO14779.1 hypothetical protein RFI_22592 [Reticulomyxa filosa]